MTPQQIILKKQSVTGKVPLVTDLDYGELAINYTDGALYYKKSDNTIGNLIITPSTDALTLGGIPASGYAQLALAINAFTSTTPSTSPTTGAITIAGGVGIAGTLNLGGLISIGDATDASSTTTAAAVVSGGLAVAKSIVVGAEVHVALNGLKFSSDKAIQSTLATVAPTAIDTFSSVTYRSAKYIIQITQGASFQSSEILVMHDGTNTYMTEYGVIESTGSLASIATDISASNVRLLITMASATAATINIRRTTIVV